jgi:hypothetical protein
MEEAHVINVAERSDRMMKFVKDWEGRGIAIIREDAFKPDGVSIRNVYDAVFLKHRQILEAAKHRGDEYCLIMEDDAIPCNDFELRFKHIKDYLHVRNDWDVFNGGMLSMRDCVTKIVRIKDDGLTTMLLTSVRGCMGQFLYFRVDDALRRLRSWEAEGKPEFDGWYPHYLRCIACVPFLAMQSDGFSDAAKDERKWEDRFKFEETSMLHSLREFLTDDPPVRQSTPADASVPPPSGE